ncbi:MAG: 4Fe-4S binding protein, partial [Anaerolineae bacterium]
VGAILVPAVACSNLAWLLSWGRTAAGQVTAKRVVLGVMMSVSVIESRCPQNHPCPSVRVCPVGALSQRGNDAPVVDEEKCIDCGKCVRSCPRGALRS